VEIRRAAAAEMDEVGDIRIAAYVRGGYLSEDSGYVPTLRGLGAHRDGEVFVAIVPSGDDGRPAERIVGTIMLQPWPHAGEVVTGPDEAEIRALAVRPEAQGQGVGKQLLTHVLRHAAELGLGRLVLCTEPAMRAAHRLYERAGFVRMPERDWSPAPGTTLLAYGLAMNGSAPAG
jgi:ribosomal protein S18 acetylase RimI-like enzyme